MGYDRKIKYLELIEEGIAIQNAGFVKLEVNEGEVNIGVKVEKLKTTDDGAAQIFLLADDKEVVLGELRVEQGKGTGNFEGIPEKRLAGSVDYEELNEIQIRLQSDRMLRCIIREKREEKVKERPEPEEEELLEAAQVEESVFAEEPERKDAVMILDTSEEDQTVPIVRESIPEPAKEMVGTGEREERVNPTKAPAATKWKQLWDSYPHIRPFEDHREYLKLKPEDLVLLTRECYPLVANSFLLHGFYNYKHLILTKETVRGQEQYYIGAPGNFYTKEKQVAILFGFESFEGKSEPAQNGDFGYYMIPVEI